MSDRKKIGELAKVRRGASPRPIDNPKYFGGDIGWIRISDVTSSKKYLRKTEQYVSPLGESLSVKVNKGDLIMSICGTVGRPIIIDLPSCIHDGFVQLYNINADTEYLYYILQFHSKDLEQKGQPGTQVNLNTTIVEDFQIFVPESIPLQKKIAKILSTVDGLIEKTQSSIAKYKAIKQGMLHDLFTRGIDMQTGKLRPKHNDAPELYKESELGMVPKEWDAKKLGKESVIEYGKSQKGVTSLNATIPVYGTGGLMEYATEYLFNGESILIGRKGTIDKPFFVTGKFWTVDTAYYLSFFTGNVRWLHSQLERYGLKRLNEATGVPSINRGQLYNIMLAFPKKKEQDEIVKRILVINGKIKSEQSYLQKLQQIKTGLMNDLLTGKKKVNIA